MKNIDSKGHLRGESIYVDDLPLLSGTLFATFVGSPVAHGKLKGIDSSEALKLDGVVKVITAKDIPGENQIGGIIPDEVLLAEDLVDFIGMPVAVVVGKSEHIARKAADLVKLDIEELSPILCPREAKEKKSFLVPPRTFSIGKAKDAFKDCDHVFEGKVSMGGQEHTYLETQGCYAYPMENGHFKVRSSTQSPTAVQRMCAQVLGVPMHMIESDVIRLGGGFGGKEDQASPWACMAALASHLTKAPVKIILHRQEDILVTGKRHPYEFDFKIGLTKDLKIMAYDVDCFQNGGAVADLSPAIMERTLFHGGGSYFLPNANITVYSCKTNFAPNTAFRGFGGPQGMFVLECAILKAAEELGVDRMEIQRKNLLSEGDTFPYGQIAKKCEAGKCWDKASKDFDLDKMKKEVEEFNKKNTHLKKGISVFPLCFGISFTKLMLNQARSLVHIYYDGSIAISTGVIEMGQGVNTKISQVAQGILGVTSDRIKMISTNTTRVANASPTAASSGADLNGHATRIACEALKARLSEHAAKQLGADVSKIEIKDDAVFVDGKRKMEWKDFIWTAYENRVCLSEHGHYATPKIHFDKDKEKGHPFAYHVYGTAITVVTVDCIRGMYHVDAVKIVHDFGRSMNMDIDRGQIEGGLLQGLGLMTIEELRYNDKGKNLHDSLSMYKVPDIYFTPEEISVEPLGQDDENLAILGSKAVGEPPLMYGLGAYFAIHEAVKAFNPDHALELKAPYTHQRCLSSLYDNYKCR